MNRKLKPPILGTEGIIGILAISTFIFLAILSYKLAMGFGALICIVAATTTAVVMLRTGNIYFLPLMLGQLFATAMMTMVAIIDKNANLNIIFPMVVLMGISFTLAIIFTLQRKLKWRTREMLELAAQPVEDKTNGLTQRPFQAGEIEYSPGEIMDFSVFIRRNLIAIPVFEKNRTVFILNIPLKKLLQFSKNYDQRTWVAFSYDGKVHVNIQQNDYFMYRDQLAFDKLCQSLGDLFIEFMNLYQNGEEGQIIYRLNALNLNIITEG